MSQIPFGTRQKQRKSECLHLKDTVVSPHTKDNFPKKYSNLIIIIIEAIK